MFTKAELIPTDLHAESRRRGDWSAAFAKKLESLGALEGRRELSAIGNALYPHYDLIEADDVARAAWKKWPVSLEPIGRDVQPPRRL